MLAIFLIGSPLLIIAGLASYFRWKGHSESEGYPQSVGGYLIYQFDFLAAFAGGIALAFAIDAFKITDPNSVTAVIALIKGGACVMFGGGLLLVLLKTLKFSWGKFIVYLCIVGLFSIAVARHQEDERRAAEAAKHPKTCVYRAGHRDLVCDERR